MAVFFTFLVTLLICMFLAGLYGTYQYNRGFHHGEAAAKELEELSK